MKVEKVSPKETFLLLLKSYVGKKAEPGQSAFQMHACVEEN